MSDSTAKEKSFYRLSEVRECVRSGRYRIRAKALETARDELGLDSEDIKDLLLNLKTGDFHKSMTSSNIPGLALDVYRPVVDDSGLVAYVKFGIDDDRGELLILFSCKGK